MHPKNVDKFLSKRKTAEEQKRQRQTGSAERFEMPEPDEEWQHRAWQQEEWGWQDWSSDRREWQEEEPPEESPWKDLKVPRDEENPEG